MYACMYVGVLLLAAAFDLPWYSCQAVVYVVVDCSTAVLLVQLLAGYGCTAYHGTPSS